MFEIVRN